MSSVLDQEDQIGGEEIGVVGFHQKRLRDDENS